MSTSPLKYRTVFPNAVASMQVIQPVGTVEARDYLLNNLCHYADGYGQQIVKWSATPAAVGGTATGVPYMTTETIAAPLVPYPIAQFPCPLRIRASGNSYRVRLRIGGAGSTADGVRFFAALALPGAYAQAPLFDGTDWAWGVRGPNGDAAYMTDIAASATPAWLTGESLGTNEWETMIALNPAQVANQLQYNPTIDIEGGNATTVRYLNTSLVIFGMQVVAPAVPRLYAVEACEWVGLDT